MDESQDVMDGSIKYENGYQVSHWAYDTLMNFNLG